MHPKCLNRNHLKLTFSEPLYTGPHPTLNKPNGMQTFNIGPNSGFDKKNNRSPSQTSNDSIEEFEITVI